MTKGRDTAAGNIGNVLDVVRVQQGSGWLRAKYSQGTSWEEGELYVLSGQPIYARSGNLTGYEALNRLLSWQNIHFSFNIDSRCPPANIPPDVAYRTVTASLRNPTIPPAQVPPAAYRPVTAELFPILGNTSYPEVFSRQSASTRLAPLASPNNPPSRETFPAPVHFLGTEQMIPKKIGPDREGLALPLERRQRFIYFLVDGRRTIGDIARCTNRSVNDVEITLSELQDSGLIQL